MGCHKSKCKFCSCMVRASDQFTLMILELDHLKEKHKEIWDKNRKAKLQYKKDCKKALDKQLKNSVSQTFSQSEWDAEDYAD